MTALEFSPVDTKTWPVVLNVQQTAAIYHKTVPAMRRAVLRHFTPAPYRRHPMLWRRAAVLADVEGARGGSSLRVAV